MSNRTPTTLSARWQKAQVLSVVIASLAIPVIVGLIGNSYSASQKREEIGARYVELAVGILRSEPVKESSALRIWAISVLAHFSPVPLPQAAMLELESQRLTEIQSLTQKWIDESRPRYIDELLKKLDESKQPREGR